MRRSVGILLVLIVLCSGVVAQQNIDLKPFTIDHRAADGSVVNLSFLLEAPAGKNGYIQVKDGHLVTPKGKRFRIWGVNITQVAPESIHFPPKQDAEFWAATLARLGVNCVRLHFVDLEAPKGIIAPGLVDSREFDSEQLDRLDYFIAALKKHGIYSDLNLNVGRTYKAGDGVRDYELIGWGKALTFFDPRLIELQKEYAAKLLNHYNPYTKSEYRNEPSIAIIEMVNENSIVAAWKSGRLRGLKTNGPPEGWQDITPYYELELTRLYNNWLIRTLDAPRVAALRAEAGTKSTELIPRLVPEQFSTASRERFETELSFYMELESNFYRDMRKYLKQDLGCKSLLIGTSDYTHGHSSYPMLSSTSQLDIVDSHGPWDSQAMVREPLNSIPVRVSRAAFAGKPFVVTEHNHRFTDPSNYSSEGIPLLAAYAAFQDWDGIFLYTFETKPPSFVPYNGTRADISYDPVKIPNLAVGALMFLRKDIDAARETVARSYSRTEVFESLRLPGSEGVYFTPNFSASVALRHGSRIASLDGAPTQTLAYETTSPIVSDTKQLAWYFDPHVRKLTNEVDQKFTSVSSPGGNHSASHPGMVVIDGSRSQGLVGFISAYKNSTSNLSADIRNQFATLVLTSLDSKSIAQSSRMLLSAGARVANTRKPETTGGSDTPTMVGPIKSRGMIYGGTSPTLIEPVTGRLLIRNLKDAEAVYSSALDGAGRRIGLPVPATKTTNGWAIAIGDPVTTWYEITVARR
jgi:hypothetical protein